jgi:hypothetical protein
VKRFDLTSCIIFFFLAAFLIWQAAFTMPLGRIGKPGPGFLPFWLGIILALLSAILWVDATVRKQPPSEGQTQPVSGKKRWPLNVIWTTIAILVYSLLIEYVGFFICTFFLLLFLFGIIGRQKWWVALLGSCLVTLICHYGFRVALQVQLPRGIFSL